MIFLQGLAAKVIEWALTKVGAYLSNNIKVLMAKIALWLKIRKERNADHAKMKEIREKLEQVDVNDDKAVSDILDQLRNHF
jgi:hypothetical protein